MCPWTGRWRLRPGGRTRREYGWPCGGCRQGAASGRESFRPPSGWTAGEGMRGSLRRPHWPSPPLQHAGEGDGSELGFGRWGRGSWGGPDKGRGVLAGLQSWRGYGVRCSGLHITILTLACGADALIVFPIPRGDCTRLVFDLNKSFPG